MRSLHGWVKLNRWLSVESPENYFYGNPIALAAIVALYTRAVSKPITIFVSDRFGRRAKKDLNAQEVYIYKGQLLEILNCKRKFLDRVLSTLEGLGLIKEVEKGHKGGSVFWINFNMLESDKKFSVHYGNMNGTPTGHEEDMNGTPTGHTNKNIKNNKENLDNTDHLELRDVSAILADTPHCAENEQIDLSPLAEGGGMPPAEVLSTPQSLLTLPKEEEPQEEVLTPEVNLVALEVLPAIVEETPKTPRIRAKRVWVMGTDPELEKIASDWLKWSLSVMPWTSPHVSWTEPAFSKGLYDIMRATGLNRQGLRELFNFISKSDFWAKNALSPIGLLRRKEDQPFRKIDHILNAMQGKIKKRITEEEEKQLDFFLGKSNKTP